MLAIERKMAGSMGELATSLFNEKKKSPFLPQNCSYNFALLFSPLFSTIKTEEMERKRQKEINIFVKQIWHKARAEKRGVKMCQERNSRRDVERACQKQGGMDEIRQ